MSDQSRWALRALTELLASCEQRSFDLKGKQCQRYTYDQHLKEMIRLASYFLLFTSKWLAL